MPVSLSRSLPVLAAAGLAAVVVTVVGEDPSGGQGVAVNPVEGNAGFLLMTEGDAFLGADESEGPAAIGGNLTFNTYNVFLGSPVTTPTAPGDTVPIALLVRGRVDLASSASSLQLPTGGYLKIGDPTGVEPDSSGGNTRVHAPGAGYDATPNIALALSEPAASVTTPVPTSVIDFDAAFADFRDRSAGLAECPSNVQLLRRDDSSPIPGNVVTDPGTPVRITLLPGVQNVLDIDAASLDNIGEITFDDQPTADSPLVVNVDTSGVGDQFDWTTPNTPGISGAQAPYILWNFPTATRVTIPGNATVEGTLYAPNAFVQVLTTNNVEGNVIARSFQHGAPPAPAPAPPATRSVRELHNFQFATELTPCRTTPPASTTTTTTMPTTTSTTASTTTSTTSTTLPATTSTTTPSTLPSTTTPGGGGGGDHRGGGRGSRLPDTGAGIALTAGLGAALVGAGVAARSLARDLRRSQ